jgi:hypothetical protein
MKVTNNSEHAKNMQANKHVDFLKYIHSGHDF